MLPEFCYQSAETVREAVFLLASGNAAVVAGGTDLLVQMRASGKAPEVVVDVSGVPEMTQIEEKNGMIRIGAACRLQQLMDSGAIRDRLPALAQAAGHVGSPQIRHRATLAGNVQTASPAADCLVALWAQKTDVCLVSLSGERRMPLQRFVIGPKKTCKKTDEIITDFWIDVSKEWDIASFFKVGRRNALAISVLNGAVQVRMNPEKKVETASVCMGASGPIPLRMTAAEHFLTGKELTKETLAEFERLVSANVNPISDLRASSGYRRYLAGILCRRQLEEGGEERTI